MKKVLKISFAVVLAIAIAAFGTYQFFPGAIAAVKSKIAFHDAHLKIKRLDLNGDIFEYAEGEGKEYTIFVHGFHSDKSALLGYARDLSKKFRPLLLDLSGHGGSSRHKGQHYDMISLSGNLARFIDGKGIKQCHLVGNSMGGGVILYYYLSHPEKVKSISLINPLGVEPPVKSDFQQALDRGKNYLIPDDMEDFKQFEKIVVGRPLKYNDHFKKYIFETMRESQKFYRQAFSEMVSTPAMDKEVYDVRVPVLLLGADRDRVLDFSSYELFKAKLPHAKFVRIEGGAHVLVDDAFKKAKTELHLFLNEAVK